MIPMTIAGQSVPGQASFSVTNPSTEETFDQAPDASPADLDRAVASAEEAFRTWRRDENARREALRSCAAALRKGVERLAPLFTAEQGRPLAGARLEVEWSAAYCEATAVRSLPGRVVKDDEKEKIEVVGRPLGVVGAIVPWNYPLYLAIWKVAQALLAGNTVVLKPSPYTPLATLEMGRLLNEVLPPGVLNIVSGGNDLGGWMTAHPGIRKISFTGSTATGKLIAAAVAPSLKRLTLELGGNDAAVVLADADITKTAQKIFLSAFYNSGQTCFAVKRIYAHQDIASALTDALVRVAKSMPVGDGMDPRSVLGPVNNKMQFEKLVALSDDSQKNGATFHGGGPRSGKGYFVDPTIVTGLDDTSRLVTEEQFGPLLPLLTFRDEQDAINRANASPYGLGGSVWTRNSARGGELAALLECGSAGVNQHVALDPDLPFGGAKASGLGFEHGEQGLEAYTQLQVVRTLRA